jgi:Ran GTPase-activating protein (RanGAP) involved in mRNA processing and transport
LTSFVPQTLTTLSLDNNLIGAAGAQYLANALQQNKVTKASAFFFFFTHYFLQTLITLNLNSNKIGAEGAQHLANTLKTNNVIQLALIFFALKPSFTIFYRPSQHFSSIIMTSVL